ncbi:MAG: UDP-N-acetylmuramate--L-alanine ligase [candidate division TA06 bacterium ADurb.Bin131]|uniref:UDP-N-acetylmuramate--L-alanine ligase n=1 Tax=candidate division TA06 bacterium ADurb.Bin131 TaxID=1852827 RepID=A0A1V6C589_UNCT6|nr:MAG: UDP-N-acetylmuramate--L-alanine ligase [candidate division TA06 bacterium ADurb.Bin131]
MAEILDRFNRIHIIGIGGSGTSGLAKILKALGKIVQGSDLKQGPQTKNLESLGIKIFYGHVSENISRDIDLVIRSQAVNYDNPEYCTARNMGIPVINYPKALGLLMREKKGIAVSGTHGKTTTSAMIAFMLKYVNHNPDFVIGGEICGIGNSGVGNSGLLVVEACEYKRSFLNLEPEIGVITAIEEDHLDYYRDIKDIQDAFENFSERIMPGGTLIGMSDDPAVADVMKKCGVMSIGYGLKSGNIRAKNINLLEDGNRFDCFYNGELLGGIFCSAWGIHNVLNALAVISVGITLGIPFSDIAEALKEFPGVFRRSQIIGKVNGIVIIDDYGHHPTEIVATLKGLRQRFPSRRIIVVFQPHQYSRTRFLLKDFASSFNLCDEVIVPDIYFVRDSENERKLINSEILVEKIQNQGTKAKYIPEFDEIVKYLVKNISRGDVVITIGAGPVYEVGLRFKTALEG